MPIAAIAGAINRGYEFARRLGREHPEAHAYTARYLINTVKLSE